MKNYLVKSYHTVYEDSFENGEGEQTNSYFLKEEMTAENPKEAAKQFIENSLFYKFSEEYFEPLDGEFHYSTLVEAEKYEATESEIEQWKKEEKKLYANQYNIEVFELVKQTF